jgi:hypothetical protein
MKAAESQQRAEWHERERKYKRIIQEMKEQLRQQDSVVPIGLYQAAVDQAKKNASSCKRHQDEAVRLLSRITELERQNDNWHDRAVAPRRLSNPSVEIKASSSGQLAQPLPHDSPAPETHNKLLIRTNDKLASRAVEKPEPEPTFLHAKRVAFAEIKGYSSNLRPKAVTVAIQTPKRKNANLLQKHEVKTPLRMEATFTPIAAPGSNEERSKIRMTIVRNAGGRKSLQKRLQQLRSPSEAKKIYKERLDKMHVFATQPRK